MAVSLREQVLATIEAMHAGRGQEDSWIVNRLMSLGLSEIDSEVLLAFVGLAFAASRREAGRGRRF
jgi:hypothetical protein